MARSSQIVRDAVAACRRERAQGYREVSECLVEKVSEARAKANIRGAGELPLALHAEIDRATQRYVASARRKHVRNNFEQRVMAREIRHGGRRR